ncbi:hypothetical protein RhiirC2_787640 [Rhizophagus irregularis]|uniref:Uncharacterized protein n=1 Tax=Rhizophagus irregularis TaxID=588596 RepID=A0A2N1MRT1_9GLOM|nr:hypothetical protein RhiirC2_787640 [Rhizophagus irregularis]
MLGYISTLLISKTNQTNEQAQSKSTYNHTYFHNKILDQYPNLYRECSSENFNYYGITDEISYEVYICPLCKLSNDDEEIEEKGPITYKAKSDSELIIKSILEHFPYLKFGNSFRGIDNYDFTSPLPWNSPCPICDGKHGNYGLHDEWYHKNGNQFPYDPELAKLYSQDKLEYYLTCFTPSNKFKFAIVA